MPRALSVQRRQPRAAHVLVECVFRLRCAALSLPGLVDARRDRSAPPRRGRGHARDAALDHTAAAAAAAHRLRRACGCRDGRRAGARARPAAAEALLEPARRGTGRPRLRPPRPLQHRAHRRAGRQARGGPTLVRGGRTPRARAHPQPRRRHHLLHARSVVRVPARRDRPLRLHPARRKPGDGLEPRLAARRSRRDRLPDPQCRAPVARDLRGRPRFGPGRTGRRAPARARRAAAAVERDTQTALARPPRSRAAARPRRRHETALPARRDRRVRGRAHRDDRLRQRRPVALHLRDRPARLALPRRRRVRAARRRSGRRRDLARGVRRARRRAGARLAVARRPGVRARARPRPRARARAVDHGRRHPAPRADDIRRACLGGRARRRHRAPVRLDQKQRVGVAPRPRRAAPRHSAGCGAACRSRGADRLHGRLLRTPGQS